MGTLAKTKITDLAVYTLQFHSDEALPRHAPHRIVHPGRPEPRPARDLPRQMLAHDGPRVAIAVVAMQAQDARETLDVVVHERVVQLVRGLLARRRHDAVPREKRKLGAGAGVGGGRGQRRGMYAQPAQVAQDEARRRQSGTGEAQERILWVRFEGDSIMEQGWDDGRHEEPRVPFFFRPGGVNRILSRSSSGMPKSEGQGERTRGRRQAAFPANLGPKCAPPRGCPPTNPNGPFLRARRI
jgi:hypothetical protein